MNTDKRDDETSGGCDRDTALAETKNRKTRPAPRFRLPDGPLTPPVLKWGVAVQYCYTLRHTGLAKPIQRVVVLISLLPSFRGIGPQNPLAPGKLSALISAVDCWDGYRGDRRCWVSGGLSAPAGDIFGLCSQNHYNLGLRWFHPRGPSSPCPSSPFQSIWATGGAPVADRLAPSLKGGAAAMVDVGNRVRRSEPTSLPRPLSVAWRPLGVNNIGRWCAGSFPGPGSSAVSPLPRVATGKAILLFPGSAVSGWIGNQSHPIGASGPAEGTRRSRSAPGRPRPWPRAPLFLRIGLTFARLILHHYAVRSSKRGPPPPLDPTHVGAWSIASGPSGSLLAFFLLPSNCTSMRRNGPTIRLFFPAPPRFGPMAPLRGLNVPRWAGGRLQFSPIAPSSGYRSIWASCTAYT